MLKILFAFLIATSISFGIENGVNCDASNFYINDCDHFVLKDPNHALHFFGGALTTIILIQGLKKIGINNKIERTIIGGLLNYTLWTSKEFFHDEFASAGNNKGNLLGSGLGMIISISLF